MSRDDTPGAPARLSPDCGDHLISAPSDRKTEWICPYCDHSLRYRPEISDVAELAICSHMERRHSDKCDH